MRSQVIQTQRNVIILDAYNANPTSMKASVSTFEQGQSQVLLILGDMLELGEKSEYYHKEIVNLISAAHLKAILVGKAFGKVQDQKYKTFENVQALIESEELSKVKNHHILIKASRGVKLEQVVDYL